MKRLTELGPNHKAACRLRIEGRDNDFIASELNVTKRTLAVWFSDDKVKEYLQQLAENVETEFAIQLARGGMVAIRELTELAQADTKETYVHEGEIHERPLYPTIPQKINAIQQLLDRLPSTARNEDRAAMVSAQSAGQPAGQGDTTNILTLIGGMENHELADVVKSGLSKMQGTLPSGNGNGAG